jgi:hypothetical protein
MMNVITPHHKTSLRLLVSLLALFVSWFPGHAQVPISGVITQNTTFSKDNNPYIVVEDVIVPEGITLTIEPGTLIEFQPFRKLTVKGTMIAAGTEEDSVFFSVFNKPNDLPWMGLEFENAHTQVDPSGNYLSGSVLSYASFYHASNAVILSGNSGILIEHSLVHKCDDGITINYAENCIIRDCRITGTGIGIFISSESTARNNIITNNQIANNYLFGFLVNNSNNKVQQNNFSYNRVENNYIGIYIGNEGPPDVGNNLISNNEISSNDYEGVRIQQDSIVFKGNFVHDNEIGLTLRLTEGTRVSENVFTHNDSCGLLITDSACNNSIVQNSISRNGGGIRISAPDEKPALNNTFLYNTIYQNRGTSLLIESAPQGPIHFNSFYLNGELYSFLNQTPYLIEAENNWWGASSDAKIDSMIYDILDNPSLGLVRYHSYLSQPDTNSPILPPRNVIKRQVGDDVLVSWDPVTVSDLKGYYIYYGALDGNTFTQKIDAGNVTSWIIPSHSVFDSIAVSAYDKQSDGLNDLSQGHESEYVLAALSPYAGPDKVICIDAFVFLHDATAFNYEAINWSTSGDGLFTGSHILKTTYIPGPADYLNRHVVLTLKATGIGFSLSDQVEVTFIEPPVAFAGNDTLVLSDTTYLTASATSGNSGLLKWETSGDGTFENDTLLVASYRPGPQDLANGSFVLTLHSVSQCGSATDDIIVTIVPSCSINGRVHAGDQLAGGSRLQLYTVKDDIVSPVRSEFTTPDGNFDLRHMVLGDYYIYAIPDKALFPAYAPTYYFDKIHWDQAFKLPITEDTYDIDINLKPFAMSLPEGEGSISGECMASGSAGPLCGNVVVLLYDKSATYLLGWTQLDENGTFIYNNLPYGEYLMVGEKAGYQRIFSQLITLSPDHPVVSDAQIHIESFKISIIIPSVVEGPKRPIRTYPVPVMDRVYFYDLPFSGSFGLIVTGSDGKSFSTAVLNQTGEPCSLDVSALPAGLYLIQVYSADNFLQTLKIFKR